MLPRTTTFPPRLGGIDPGKSGPVIGFGSWIRRAAGEPKENGQSCPCIGDGPQLTAALVGELCLLIG